MKFLDGLYSYEVVSLVLGAVLFLVLLARLIKAGPSLSLLPFFAVSIVMIGFPSIKSVEFHNGIVKIEKTTHALEQDPAKASLREALSQEVTRTAARPSSDPRVPTTLARAQIALGDDAGAEANLQKALRTDPQSVEALQLKKRIELTHNLISLTSRVEQNPKDATAKTELEKTVAEVTRYPIASPTTLTTVARAQVVMGDRKQALSTVEKALTINPNLAPAKQVKSQIKTMMLQPK